MNKRADYILKIKKYLNGELDARGAHELEKLAQDDPFLMDAMEGYEAGGYNHADLTKLGDRLHQRVEPGRLRMISLRYVSIAASVLILLSAGIWWAYRNQGAGLPVIHSQAVVGKLPGKSRTVAKLTKPENDRNVESRSPKLIAAVPIEKKSKSAMRGKQNLVVNQLKPIQPPAKQLAEVDKVKDSVGADTTPLNEMIVMAYNSPKKDTDTSLFIKKAKKVAVATTPPAQLLEGKAKGVNIYSNGESPDPKNSVYRQGYLGNLPLNQLSVNQTLEGRVVAKDNGKPITGALIKVAGTDEIAKTNADGRFSIKADSNHSNLVVVNSGYKTRTVSANKRDTANNIALEPSRDDLAETAVTGYTSAGKNDTIKEVVGAHPVQGWDAYRSYLKKNAVTTNGKKCVVRLVLTVDKRGNVSDIEIKKGVSDLINKMAITLIKTGPAWVGSSNGKPEEIHLRIHFAN